MVSWGFARLYYLIHLIVQIGSLWERRGCQEYQVFGFCWVPQSCLGNNKERKKQKEEDARIFLYTLYNKCGV